MIQVYIVGDTLVQKIPFIYLMTFIYINFSLIQKFLLLTEWPLYI